MNPPRFSRISPVGRRVLVFMIVTVLATLCAAHRASSTRAEAGSVYLPVSIGRPAFAALPLGDGFNQVTAITHAGDGRLFVVERGGRIKILYPDGHISLFLDISGRVVAEPGEYGMYDVAFHPDYGDPASAGYGFFYVTYTGRVQGETRLFVSRFAVTANPDAADPTSEAWLMRVDQSFSWHKGGELDFNPADDYLYAGIGDDQQPLLAQSDRSPKGKIVRLAVDSVPRAARGDATSLIDDEVWGMGLRNPWRFDVDPPAEQIFIGEVGDHLWEEVDVLSLNGRFTNFGWPCMEGTESIPTWDNYQECNNAASFRRPVHQYDHSEGRCAIIGGKVYRPRANPNDGRFIFGDLCSREVFALSLESGAWQSTILGILDTPELLMTIGEDVEGNLLVGTVASAGPLYRLIIP